MDSEPSTPSTSRPVSRAQSDVSFATATEHTPDSPQRPRSMVQEVDHIKSLISRSQAVPRQSEGIITAQIFRRRSNSTEPVPHTRIMHDLDNLKRRIRQQETLIRRPSQMDPETEDEDEVLDEREEELDDIKRELANERAQREEWLASAEHRVDILTSEKDGLMQQLDETKGQLTELQSDKGNLEHRARDAETKAQGLQEQLEHIQNSSDAARRENEDLQASYDDAQDTLKSVRMENEGLSKKLDAIQQSLKAAESSVEDLRSEKDKSDSAAEKLKEELAKLQQNTAELEATLAQRNDKISGLEDSSQIASQHLQRIISEHKAKDEESQSRIQGLQDSHAAAQRSVEESHSKITELEKNASDHDIRRQELVQQADEQRKLLDNAKKDIELHSKELKQLLKEHENTTSQAKSLTEQRDALQSKYNSLLKEKDVSAHDMETGHQEAIKSMTERHEAELKRLRDELDEAANAHSLGLENARSIHIRELDDLRATIAKEKEAASNETTKLRSHISELSDNLSKAEAGNEDLRRDLQNKEESHESHVRKAEESMAEMEQRITLAEKRAEDADASLKAKELDLNTKISAKQTELTEIHGQLSGLQQKLHDQSAELDRKINELFAAAEERKKLEEDGKGQKIALQELQQKHASEIEELRSSHKSAVAKHDAKREDAERQLTDLQAQHAAEVSAVKASYEESAGQTSSEHQTALANLKQDLAKIQTAMEAASKNSEEQVSRLKIEHEQHVRELESGWSSKADEAARSHQADMQSAADEASARLTRAHEESQKDLDERNADADARLASVREEHAAELAKAQKEHQSQLGEAKTALDQAKQELESSTADRGNIVSELELKASEIERLRSDHERALADAQTTLEAAKQELTQKHDTDLREALSNANRENEVRMQARMQVNYGKAYEENKRMFEDRAAEAEKASTEKFATREAQHRKELQDLASKHQGDMDLLRQEHEESSKASIERELNSAREKHQAELDDIHRAHEESAKAMVDRELQSAKDKHSTELDDLSRGHEEILKSAISRELESVNSSHQAEIEALRRSMEGTSKAVADEELESVRRSHQAELAAVHKGSEEAMNQIREDADREWRRRIARLEEEHESALAAALANADEELDERLRAQSKSHSKQFDRLQESLHGELESLQMQLEEATELRLAQTRQADADSQKNLAELGEKLKAAEQSAAQLQARLDIELTGRAESERSLADLRKQRFDEEKRMTASTESLQKQIDRLTSEKAALYKRNSAIFLPRDPTSSVDDSSTTRDAGEELSVLRLKLAVAEQEREQAQIAGQQEAEERSELERQNEFLVKELETLMATRSAEAAAVPIKQDAFVQTDLSTDAPDENIPREVQEQKSDASLSAAAKHQQQSPSPVPPSTPKQGYTKGISNGTSKRGSFEQYLQQAQAELSELGSVITANEALFAQKIQEHFGDLQRAKDSITSEYEAKFKALLTQRDKMEKDFSAKTAAEFAQERRQLVASYVADQDEPEKQAAAVTNLPSPKRQELRNAEEQLVSEYNRRIVKRKSQIAMKHAEDYQNLTQDFDRRLAELLGNRQKLEGDLSVEPSKFERDLGQYEAMSAKLENEKANSTPNSPQAKRFSRDLAEVQSKKATPGGSSAIDYAARSQLPKRTVSVTPKASTGIPRAVPFPGNRESLDVSNQPHRPRRSVDALKSVSERHPLLKQQSGTIKSPTTPKNITSNPRSSDKSPIQPIKSKFSADPSESEQKPLPSEPPKPTPHAFRSMRNKGKSLRHSSRIIVGDWQATNDI